MDFVSASLVGGVLYDVVKSNGVVLKDMLKEKVKESLFSEDELKTLQDVATTLIDKNPSYTKDEFISAVQNNQNFQDILQQQNIHVEKNDGMVIGNNSGTINFNAK